MASCKKCGANVPDDKKFCTGCGKPMGVKAPVKTAPTTKADTGKQPSAGSPYAVMGVGSYVGASLLMSIPVIGWIICIIWALGGCNNRNKRNYARAVLIFMIIGVLVSFVIYTLINRLIGGTTALLQQIITESTFGISGMVGVLQELLEALRAGE